MKNLQEVLDWAKSVKKIVESDDIDKINGLDDKTIVMAGIILGFYANVDEFIEDYEREFENKQEFFKEVDKAYET